MAERYRPPMQRGMATSDNKTSVVEGSRIPPEFQCPHCKKRISRKQKECHHCGKTISGR